MVTKMRASRLTKLAFALLICGVWSSSLFEVGLGFFIERLGVSLFVLFGVLLFGGFAMYLAAGGSTYGVRFYRAHSLPLLLYGLYWLVSWAGVLYSGDLHSGLLATAQYTWYTALAFATISLWGLYSIRQRTMIVTAIGLVSLAVLLGFSLYPIVTGGFRVSSAQTERFTVSVFRDYNVFTLSLLFSAAVLLMGWKAEQRLPRLADTSVYIGLVVLCVLLGILAGSRRSIVLYGPVALFVPMFALLRTRWRRLLLFLPLLALLLVPVVALVRNPELITRIQAPGLDDSAVTVTLNRMQRALQLFESGALDTSTRTLRWEEAVSIAQEYGPLEVLVGRGTRAFYAEPEFIRWGGGKDHPHNFALAALLEGGVIKLALILAFLFAWYRTIWRVSRSHLSFWFVNFVLSANLIYLISVTISSEEFFGSRHFLTIVVLYAAFWQLRQAPRKVAPVAHTWQPLDPGTDARPGAVMI